MCRGGSERDCIQDRITFRTVNGFDVLDMNVSEEEGGFWIEGKGTLPVLLSLRRDILQGDYRSVYLAWLKAMSVREGYFAHGRKSSAAKPTVPAIPAGLKQLTPALMRFVKQFDVSECLVEAAAECSPELTELAETDFRPLVARLPRAECDRLLCRFAQDDLTAGVELKRQLLAMESRPSRVVGPYRSIDELLKRAEAIEAARKRRQEQDARRKHAVEMNALAEREAETWQQVASFVDLKQMKSYDEAVRLLVKLGQLAEFRGTTGDFRRQVNDLCERYRRLSGFKGRVQQAKLLVDRDAPPENG